MSTYQPKIRKTQDGGFYAMVVRVDRDGQEQVVGHYKARHFASEAAAIRSVAKYISAM